MYKKLSKEERYQIEILFEKEHLSMHKLARNKTNNYTYNAEHAQYLANKRT